MKYNAFLTFVPPVFISEQILTSASAALAKMQQLVPTSLILSTVRVKQAMMELIAKMVVLSFLLSIGVIIATSFYKDKSQLRSYLDVYNFD